MKRRENFIDEIRDKLYTRKNEMTTILTKSTQERVTEDQVQDSGDEALSLSMEKIKNSLEQTEIDELRLIDDALKRMSRGEFGLCIDCGETISEKRIENSPYAARCIVCQEAFEGQ